MNMMDIIIDMLEEENKKCYESLEKHIESKDKDDFNQYLKYHHRAGVLIELAERCCLPIYFHMVSSNASARLSRDT